MNQDTSTHMSGLLPICDNYENMFQNNEDWIALVLIHFGLLIHDKEIISGLNKQLFSFFL